jgi:hypothetical protein
MPIQLDAKLNAFRRSSKGFYITLEIGPDSDWTELAAAPLGQAFGVAMIPYDAETGKAQLRPVPDDLNTGKVRGDAGRPRKPFHEMSRAQQAGILCNDPTFQIWVWGQLSESEAQQAGDDGAFPDDVAPVWLRERCGIFSRRTLDTDEAAAAKFDAIVSQYRQSQGLEAEQR